MSKPKVAFICVHNSCRSQIAEAPGNYLAADVFESYSAGTELKDCINPDAVRLIKQLYGIDMEQTPRGLGDPRPKENCVFGKGIKIGPLRFSLAGSWKRYA